MQAAFSVTISQTPVLLPKISSQSQSQPQKPSKLSVTKSSRPSNSIPEAITTVSYEASAADYTALLSVFPAEACETLGGDSCLYADIYPEAKLKRPASTASLEQEAFEREYLEYNDAKTVFPADACDLFGGEFCERDYQRGVY